MDRTYQKWTKVENFATEPTGLGYIVSFAALVFFVLTRNILGLRTVIGINVIIAIPVSAFIGWIVVIVSIVLSFNKKVKAYFAP